MLSHASFFFLTPLFKVPLQVEFWFFFFFLYLMNKFSDTFMQLPNFFFFTWLGNFVIIFHTADWQILFFFFPMQQFSNFTFFFATNWQSDIVTKFTSFFRAQLKLAIFFLQQIQIFIFFSSKCYNFFFGTTNWQILQAPEEFA